VNAAFVQIQDAIGEDVQEINPAVGVGNKSAYVGPALVPGGAKGRAFTAKVKIIESVAEGEEEAAPPSAHLRLGGRTARLMAQAAAAEKVPAVAVAKEATENGARGRAIAVAIAALGIVVAVGGWIVAKGPREVARPAASGAAIVAPAASSAVVPSAAATASATAGVDAGASVAPSAPTGVAPAPYKGKGGVVKGEDPYDAAAPLPVKTVEAVVPPPPPTPAPSTTVSPVVTVTPTAPPKPPAPTSPFDKPNYD
jgi:hypothetical protein